MRNRSALLVAGALSALVDVIIKERNISREIRIAVDGGLFECMPQYRKILTLGLQQLCGLYSAKIIHVKQGSGLGRSLASHSWRNQEETICLSHRKGSSDSWY